MERTVTRSKRRACWMAMAACSAMAPMSSSSSASKGSLRMQAKRAPSISPRNWIGAAATGHRPRKARLSGWM